MSNPRIMTPHGEGLQQILKILGIDHLLVHSFVLSATWGEFPVLDVTYTPNESEFAGYATKRFTLTEIPDEAVK